MDEVQQLLRKAWHEAQKHGVTIHGVDYLHTREANGGDQLLNVFFEADMSKVEKGDD